MTVAAFPTKACQVLAWWALDSVRDAFPTIAKFVLEVVAMLPRKAGNGCGIQTSGPLLAVALVFPRDVPGTRPGKFR